MRNGEELSRSVKEGRNYSSIQDLVFVHTALLGGHTTGIASLTRNIHTAS